MKKNTCALVMAAGFSKRFGSDKRFSGEVPLILRTLHNIVNNFDSIYLVHRDCDEELILLLEGLPLKLVRAQGDAICLGSSIATGLNIYKRVKVTMNHVRFFLLICPI